MRRLELILHGRYHMFLNQSLILQELLHSGFVPISALLSLATTSASGWSLTLTPSSTLLHLLCLSPDQPLQISLVSFNPLNYFSSPLYFPAPWLLHPWFPFFIVRASAFIPFVFFVH